MDKRIFIGFSALVIVIIATGESKYEPYPCSGDVCNMYGKPQFCSENNRCLDCQDKEHLCDTWRMPTNCSEFCCDRKSTKVIDILAQTCALPWNIAHGYIEGLKTEYGRIKPGDNLTFKCDDGYSLIGNKTFRCNDHGQWVPQSETPTCISKHVPSEPDGYMIALIIVSIMLFASILMNCISLPRYLKSRRLSNRRKGNTDEEQRTRTPSKYSLEENGKGQTIHLINDDQNQTRSNMGNGIEGEHHELDAPGKSEDDVSETIKTDDDSQNTDRKIIQDESMDKPRGELAYSHDTGHPGVTYINPSCKYPVQEQNKNAHKMESMECS